MKTNKRLLIAVLVAAMLVGAGCSNNGGSAASTTAASTTAAATTAAPAESTTEASEDTAPEETEPVEDETEATDGETDASETVCRQLTDAILNSGIEFTATMAIDDEEMVSDLLGYDMSIAEEYSVTTHLMSASLLEFTIIKPLEGKEQDVLDMLEQRKQTLLTDFAFYPAQVEAAEATVIGSSGGYCYMLCDVEAPAAEKALLEAIESL